MFLLLPAKKRVEGWLPFFWVKILISVMGGLSQKLPEQDRNVVFFLNDLLIESFSSQISKIKDLETWRLCRESMEFSGLKIKAILIIKFYPFRMDLPALKFFFSSSKFFNFEADLSSSFCPEHVSNKILIEILHTENRIMS